MCKINNITTPYPIKFMVLKVEANGTHTYRLHTNVNLMLLPIILQAIKFCTPKTQVSWISDCIFAPFYFMSPSLIHRKTKLLTSENKIHVFLQFVIIPVSMKTVCDGRPVLSPWYGFVEEFCKTGISPWYHFAVVQKKSTNETKCILIHLDFFLEWRRGETYRYFGETSCFKQ